MIKEKIQADQIQALKSGEKQRLETLRYILAQIKNKEIEKHGDLVDEEVVAILRKQSKEVQVSIESFKKGNRPDLATEYEAQRQIIVSYLPAEMSDEDLANAVKTLLEQNKAIYEKDPKAIIGICMRELKSKAEPSRIMKTLQSLQ